MKEIFPGEMKLYHIFHNLHIKDNLLESNRIEENKLKQTTEFIHKYKGACIIPHKKVFPELYSIPSYKIGVVMALKESADLHLWLEDDAIVYDMNCKTWPEKMIGKDVGLYRQTMHISMINCAFMLTSLNYDYRLLPVLNNYKKDGKCYPKSSQFEHLLWKHVENAILLDKNNAIRHHPYNPSINKEEVKKWLYDKIPEIEKQDIDLLDLDFKT